MQLASHEIETLHDDTRKSYAFDKWIQSASDER